MGRFERKRIVRTEKPLIFIFSEGTKTEYFYFDEKRIELRDPTVVIINPDGTGGRGTVGLLRQAQRHLEENGVVIDKTIGSDECWVVFDKDDYKDFNDAIFFATKKHYNVAASNECFELWYALHFEKIEEDIGRKNYDVILNANIAGGYKKNEPGIYPKIKSLENVAIERAKELEAQHASITNWEKKVPITTVYKLVERLNQIKSDK